MKKYFIKTPWWLRKIYGGYTWQVPGKQNTVYLTFDDGPHPEVTPFVLDQLKEHGAKATFFCIGKNVVAYPEVYRRILEEGHAVGNHTHHHLNGWKTKNEAYLQDVAEAAKYIDSGLFRPPYGRITRYQATCIRHLLEDYKAKIIMWDVLSADFDTTLNGEDCFRNVAGNVRPGSVVVFHDSEKAWDRLKICLPGTLNFLQEKKLNAAKL